MNIVSYNVNGIRAAMRKGFADWLAQTSPDIIGLQEIKATEAQIETSVFEDLGYHCYWYPAVKKGYSGVAILSKEKPSEITYGMGVSDYDDEGRMIRADFGEFSFISAYFPSGTTGGIRQDFKYAFLDDVYGYTQDLIKSRPNLILSGDYNICHKAIDIHNPIANKNTSGFLPDERAWMDKLTSNGFDDSFRLYNQSPHQYSWWTYRANARANNKGWRIDYHMTSSAMNERVKGASIMPDAIHSDHCPVLVEIG
ncbi:exodeoxyribonuclease III [Echinicola vietnamensis]|uniref:Exodeoxyribonuclease III n=1 Tax=Echinicola vietnamensis (strain DSM 17526 / LMG 23754 / KMM 6221) TaxID=926556 RepID=L0FVJ0_ECHVK|nr:exodeoxyribonuclease III [Echinicola vietnamensis]AGA77327.1 exodeoxyribonuclease III [Echinicola vietnamensis DSM 17526]